jgi:hypothetical protein
MKKYAIAFLFNLLTTVAATATPSYLYYTGNGYTAGGHTDTISSLNGFVFIPNSSPSRNNVSFFIDDFAANPIFQNAQFFLLYFAAPRGSDLQVGNYENATRAPFQDPGVPGLWFAGNGRGSNQITGRFDVLDVSFASDNTIASLAVDFLQNDENGFLGQSYGSFRYQSNVPITHIPEPPTLTLAILGLFVVAPMLRRQRWI